MTKPPLAEIDMGDGYKLGFFEAYPEHHKDGYVAWIACVTEGQLAALYSVDEATAEAIVEGLSLMLLRFEDSKGGGDAGQPAV